MSARNAALGLAALMLAASASGAQTQAGLLLGAGSATDLRGVRSGAYLLAPSLSFALSRNSAMVLGGRLTRFTNEAWSVAGNAATAVRVPLTATVGALLTGSGEVVRTSYRATYLSATGIPALEWRPGGLSLWGGLRLATARRTLESAVRLPTEGSVSRSLTGPAFGAGYRRGGLRLSYREEHSRPDGVAIADRTASVLVSRGPLTLGGSLGLRRGEDERRTFGGAQVSFGLTRGIELVAAAESYPSNRLTGALPGRAFTAGLSLGLGGPRESPRLPKPGGVPPIGPGLTRLAYTAPGAASVEVAGDWNGWRPQAMTRSRNGVWYADLVIPAGYYRYAFRIDRTAWKVPQGVAAVDDGFGGKSAWLSVTAPGRTASQSANRKEAP